MYFGIIYFKASNTVYLFITIYSEIYQDPKMLMSAKFTPNFVVSPNKLMRVMLRFSINYAKISFIILGPVINSTETIFMKLSPGTVFTNDITQT